MKTITNNQDQQILLRAVQMGVQPYLQQRSPHLLLRHDGTQDHPTEKRDDPEMGSQCKRQV